jgi:hypothetical protein
VRGSVFWYSIMLMHRARLLALFTAMLAVLAVSLPARVHYFCRMMDRVVDSCCCESSAAADGECRADLKVPDCCERLTRGTLPAAEARRDLVPPLSSPALVPPEPALVLVAPEVELPNVARLAQRALPKRGPPLFLRHCALLI